MIVPANILNHANNLMLSLDAFFNLFYAVSTGGWRGVYPEFAEFYPLLGFRAPAGHPAFGYTHHLLIYIYLSPPTSSSLHCSYRRCYAAVML